MGIQPAAAASETEIIREDFNELRFDAAAGGWGSPAVTGSVGLGLSIVHAPLRGMGGSITHARTEGKTRFTVRLPLVIELEADNPFQRRFLINASAEQSTTMASLSSDEELPGTSPVQPLA